MKLKRWWMRVVPAVLFVLVNSTSVLPQASGVRADNPASEIETIKQLEIELCSLIVHGQWDDYARHVTDDYVRILAEKSQTKDEVLKEFRTSKTDMISMTPEKVDVRIYGDAAVVTIELRTRIRARNGKIAEMKGRGVKVFIRKNGKWYLAQLTSLQ